MTEKLTLHNDVQQIELLAGFVDAIADTIGIDPSTAMSLNLALEEAVTNIVAEGDANQLTFTITDSGKPFDPTQQAEADITLGVEERPIGGLGIFLVRQIMDTIAYRRDNGQNILTISKKL